MLFRSLVGLGQFFGQQQMLLVSLGVIVLALLLLRERLENAGEPEEKEESPSC